MRTSRDQILKSEDVRMWKRRRSGRDQTSIGTLEENRESLKKMTGSRFSLQWGTRSGPFGNGTKVEHCIAIPATKSLDYVSVVNRCKSLFFCKEKEENMQ